MWNFIISDREIVNMWDVKIRPDLTRLKQKIIITFIHNWCKIMDFIYKTKAITSFLYAECPLKPIMWCTKSVKVAMSLSEIANTEAMLGISQPNLWLVNKKK